MIRYLVIIFFFLCTRVSATTYYIDYTGGNDSNSGTTKSAPWKYAPFMPSFTGSYTVTTGDTFVFKGGETWVPPADGFSISASYSGTSGNPTTLTSDSTWYSGSSFTKPIFDGQNNINNYRGIITFSDYMHDFTVDGLQLINAGVSGNLTPCSVVYGQKTRGNITVSNCVLRGYSQHGLNIGIDHDYLTADLPVGLTYKFNDISHITNSVEVGGNKPSSYTYKIGIFIHDNLFHDRKSELVNGDHGDGIHLWNTNADPAHYYNGKIYNNNFYGETGGSDSQTNNTAHIYLEECADGFDIYNNVLTYSDTSKITDGYMFSPGVITIHDGRNIRIYNNTLSGQTYGGTDKGMKGIAVRFTGSDHIVIEGNVFDNITRGAISIEDVVTNVTVDYNIYSHMLYGYGSIGPNPDLTFSGWQQTLQNHNVTGAEAHGVDASVNFVSTSDLRLTETSEGVDDFPTSAAPTTLFTYDINDVSRPQGPAWDMGAYEFPRQEKYVAQTSSGTGDGSSCANAMALSSYTWTENDVLHLCGTLTDTITIGADNVTIIFEPNAKLSKASWGTGTSAAIYASGKDGIIIDGGINGIVEATDNGTSLTNQNDSEAINLSSCDNWVIKNLTVQGMYVRDGDSSDSNQYGEGVLAENCSQLKIHDCIFKEAKHLVRAYTNGTDATGFELYNCTFTRASNPIRVSTSTSNTYTNISIHDNEIYDLAPYWDGTWNSGSSWNHIDGVQMWGGDSTHEYSNIDIYNNYFHGDFGEHCTGWIYMEGYFPDVDIWNNLFVNSAEKPAHAFIAVEADYESSYANVFSNTMIGKGSSSAGGTGLMLRYTDPTIKNNIFKDLYVVISTDAGTVNFTSDYNDFYNVGNIGHINSSWYSTLSSWQSFLGGCPGSDNDCNSITTDPGLDTGYKPASETSSVVDAGTDLSATFNYDKDGVSRPQGAGWDIGAYEFVIGTNVLYKYNGDLIKYNNKLVGESQ